MLGVSPAWGPTLPWYQQCLAGSTNTAWVQIDAAVRALLGSLTLRWECQKNTLPGSPQSVDDGRQLRALVTDRRVGLPRRVNLSVMAYI